MAEIGILIILFAYIMNLFPILKFGFHLRESAPYITEGPTRAIHTTDTAEGTRVRYWAKCNFASRKPKADDFIAVSIAMVRH